MQGADDDCLFRGVADDLRELEQLRELERQVDELLPHLRLLICVNYRNTHPYLTALVATRQFILQHKAAKEQNEQSD